jgi:lysophospholipase L1-like esterase
VQPTRPAPSAVPTRAPTPPAPPPPPEPTLNAQGLRVEAPDRPAAKVTRTGEPDAGFMGRHDEYVDKARAGNIDLYMLGDSITDFWQNRHKSNWDAHLGGWKSADFGISGDRTQHVLWRINNGELDGVKPKVIVLLIGTNNLASNTVFAENSVDDTAKGVKAIVDTLKEKQPQAHILLMGVFPREDKPLNDKVDALNARISSLDDGRQVKYLNINASFTDSHGKLLKGVMLRDNLHPDDKGYDLWAAAITPLLIEWLGPPAK